MRVATPCLRRAATSFFCAPKKMKQKKGAPAGGLHSASGVQLRQQFNRSCGNTPYSGLHS